MAEIDPKKQLLSLIRNFATEKSQGERRIADYKKRIEELGSELDLANAELENAKRLKEASERDIKGFEVELSMTEASIQALEARISLIQDEVSICASNLEALKKEGGALRDEFLNKMYMLNADIRTFQAETAQAFSEDKCTYISTNNGQELARANEAEVSRRALEQKIAEIISDVNVTAQECQAEQIIHQQVQEEVTDLKRKAFLIETIMKESLQLQNLTRQTSEYEEMCASLGEELQRRCVCPSCHLDNVEALGGKILQASDGT